LGVATTGQKVKTLRQARRLSQPALAKLVGISQPSLANIESDKTKTLRGETLAGLCRVLNVSPDVLLGRRRVSSDESLLHESELIGLWRSLSQANQEHLLAIARALGAKPKRPQANAEVDGKRTTTHGHLSEH
jgi:transcriptional regulator with XRE-family HTH domain